MRRRQFITLLGGAAAWPVVARAQQAAMPVIGSLYGVSAAGWAKPMAAFRRGLNEIGFVEGSNVAIEYRWADGQFDRMPAMAAEFVSRKVAVILVGGSTAGVLATMEATRTIPIVFTTALDPVGTGLVTSLSRPGGNVTGVTYAGGQLIPKELLHELLPAATKVAVLVNPNNPASSQDAIRGADAAASHLGLEIIVVKARNDSEIEAAFATAAQQQAAAIQVSQEAFLSSRRDQIADLTLSYMAPTISAERDNVTAGALLSYGALVADTYRQAGVYVGRILRGEKPANLPVVRPTKFELVINLKTAKALRLTIPEFFLLRADEVIE